MDSDEPERTAEIALSCAVAYCQTALPRLTDGSQAEATVAAALANLQTVIEHEYREDEGADEDDAEDEDESELR